MFRIFITSFLLINSIFIFSQDNLERCDVVLGGKNKGFLDKDKFLSKPKLNFYNKYCDSKILGYEFTSAYKGKVISVRCKTDTLSNDVINFISNFNSSNRVIFKVNCIDINNKEYVSIVNLNIIVTEDFKD